MNYPILEKYEKRWLEEERKAEEFLASLHNHTPLKKLIDMALTEGMMTRRYLMRKTRGKIYENPEQESHLVDNLRETLVEEYDQK